MSDKHFARRAVWIAAAAGLAGLLCTGPAAACRNEAEGFWGAPELLDPVALDAALHPPRFDNVKALKTIERLSGQKKLDRKAENDLANALVDVGKYAEARDIWKRMEQEKPGEYFVAANLGTAYELTADNANALKWIQEGIIRNPDSHAGTEWLHVKILETKLAMAVDANWLENRTVLGLRMNGDSPPNHEGLEHIRGNSRQHLEAKDIALALEYQLGERLKFVRDPDPLVAQLLFDLGNLLLNQGSNDASVVAYNRAKDYGFASAELDARLKYAQGYPRFVLQRWMVAAGLALLFILVFIAALRGTLKQRQIAASGMAE